MRRATTWAGVAVLLAACSPADGPQQATNGVDSEAGDFSAELAANAPASFGFGADATNARIAMWDIDVKPDGEGLPVGSGSVFEGKRVYEMYCIACHGPTGTEGPNDRLAATDEWEQWPVARGVGNYWPYATTLYDYVRKAMPQNAPGSLSDDQNYAVIAYVLNLNGLLADDGVLDATSLPAIQMPARDRFVADDRVGGPEIR